ncbi:hydantoinase B/oxoprolinase family protein [Nonomuraea dietziae]|uniref:hydantoinase B/oxoprolinase family protein n=1 Tax=Nonomuraea dietziae TaxID=65515 RepID=UPI00360791D2
MNDALTAEVLRNALVVTAEEASVVVVRSAYSTFIVEGSDASAAVLDVRGRLIAQSMATTLMNSMALKVALPFLLADHPPATMAPGDAYVMNDAYRGGVHTNDLLVYRPVFVEGEPAYLTATMIHVSDLGGLSAGGMAPLATDIFLEGLQLPPVRLATAEGIVPAVEAILRANSRTPDKVMGDVRALLAGTAVAAARLSSLVTEYGAAGLAEGIDAYLDYTEARTRAALTELPRAVSPRRTRSTTTASTPAARTPSVSPSPSPPTARRLRTRSPGSREFGGRRNAERARAERAGAGAGLRRALPWWWTSRGQARRCPPPSTPPPPSRWRPPSSPCAASSTPPSP